MKRNIIVFYIVLFSGLALLPYRANGEVICAKDVISNILGTKQNILKNACQKSSDQFVFLAFWDFDGTILKGDCTEGFEENDEQVYKGLAQMAIEAGYSEIYSPLCGVDCFFKGYRNMEKIGKWLAYPFALQMLRGADVSKIQELSRNHFNNVLSKYYWKPSFDIIKALEANNIECHIISASADIFVKGAAPTLGLPVERFNGIKVMIEDGKLTEKLIYPVTWADGKTEKLKSIVEETKRLHPGKEVVILAAFGDSDSTDGPFLKYVVDYKASILPEGIKPLVVMQYETPEEYKGLFMRLEKSTAVTGSEAK